MSVSQRCSPRKKMVVILLLFFTLTCVCGLPQVPLYQAEEDHNTTLRWDGPNKKDLSFINIQCFFKSTSTKLLFEIMQGVETFQDEQFSGRVHCDREALKEGRVWIHLFRLKPEDSGNYLCDMSIYDPVKRKLENLCTEHFQLNVTSKGGVTMATPRDNPIIADVTLTEDTLPKNPEHTDLSVEVKRNHWSKVSVVIVVIVLFGVLLVLSQIKNICKKLKKDSVSNDNNNVPVEKGETLLTAADDTTIQMEREEEERVTL